MNDAAHLALLDRCIKDPVLRMAFNALNAIHLGAIDDPQMFAGFAIERMARMTVGEDNE